MGGFLSAEMIKQKGKMRRIDTVCICARSGSGPERFLTLPQGKTEVLEEVLGCNSRVMKDIAQ